MKFLFFFMLLFVKSYSSSQIEDLLLQFERPFTMITIGNDINTTLKAAALYPDSVFILTEEKGIYSLSNLIILSKKIKPDDIRILSQCEDFDVVYVPNLTKTFGQQDLDVFKDLVNLGQYIFISSGDENVFLKTEKNYLLRKTWIRDLHSEKSHFIYSTLKEKKLFKSNKALLGNTIVSAWNPGINLITFKMLEGIYPTKKTIVDQLTSLRTTPHNDWVINNMILQGSNILLIDFDDPRRGIDTYCSDSLFEAHVKLIEMNDTEEIKRLLMEGLK